MNAAAVHIAPARGLYGWTRPKMQDSLDNGYILPRDDCTEVVVVRTEETSLKHSSARYIGIPLAGRD